MSLNHRTFAIEIETNKNKNTMTRTISTSTHNIIVRTPAVNAFLANARRYNLMTAEEEVAAINAYKAGDESQANRIINSNLLFAFSVASKYAKGDEVLDLTDAAVIGMRTAIDKFDVERGVRFLSFAVHYMMMAISDYFRYERDSIIKSNTAKIGSKTGKIRERFFAENFREPSEDEIMEILEKDYGIKVLNRVDILDVKMSSVNDTASSDEDACEAGEVGELAMATATKNEYENTMSAEDNALKVKACLSVLSERDATILRMLFGIGYDNAYDMDAVAEKFGMTTENVRIIKKSALERLKNNSRIKRMLMAM